MRQFDRFADRLARYIADAIIARVDIDEIAQSVSHRIVERIAEDFDEIDEIVERFRRLILKMWLGR